jgi:16S rRNA U516 pseudouridylate synthase RsuA-like enzyme
MRVLDFLGKPFLFASMERPGQMASRSEVRRWVRQGTVLFNGECVEETEEIDFPIISVVLHPNNEAKRVTLF